METVKGFKDYSGEEAVKRQKLKEVLTRYFTLYGYEPAERYAQIKYSLLPVIFPYAFQRPHREPRGVAVHVPKVEVPRVRKAVYAIDKVLISPYRGVFFERRHAESFGTSFLYG